MKIETNKIYQGDTLQVLRGWPEGFVDCIVTDPPYGYSFMGKDWDKAVPSVEVWRECLRVLKAGAFAFVMSAPRQDVLSQMIVRLGEAGFRTDFTSIYWAYASGFPKAGNIGKMVDKKLGAERKIIGKRDYTNQDIKNNAYDSEEAKQRQRLPSYITEAATPQAQSLDGSYAGFQPKPAVEVIIVAMKSLSEKTYVDQALKNGKGVTWLDGARIPYDGPVKETHRTAEKSDGTKMGHFKENGKLATPTSQGRFPANLLVSDDCLNDGSNKRSGGVYNCQHKENKIFNNKTAWQEPKTMYADSGSFSRYFDLDAWARTLPFLIVEKASKGEKNGELEGTSEGIGNRPNSKDPTGKFPDHDHRQRGQNNHPTVKPLKLMSYLITLGSRGDDLILDPYIGSGSVGIAAMKMGRRFLGIELNKDYCAIAQKRLEQEMGLFL